jgi:hypothetical protein
MRKFRKYSFTNEAAFDAAIAALPHDEEGNPTHSHSIVRLGNIVITPGTYDEEGNEITAPVLSDSYHVDVLWNGEPDPDWDAQMVWCAPMGVHVFGSSSAIREWIEECKVQRPDLFPDPEPEEV